MIHPRNITKNSFFSLGSSVVQKLLTLVYFVLIARVFGPEDQGRYSAAIAFATLLSVFIDLGLSSALTRETAREPEKARDYLGQMFLLRIVFGILVYGVIILLPFVLGYSRELQGMIVIAGIAAVIDTVTTSCWFLIRGFRNLLYESIGSTLAVVVMMVGGIASIAFHLPVIALVYAVLAGSIANVLIALWTIFFRARIHLSMRPNWKMIRYLGIIALPFAGSAIFSRIYTFADVAILTRLAGEHSVGLYSAGNKLMLALNILPASLSASLYPALSAYVISNEPRIAPTMAKAVTFLSLIALPLSVGIGITSPLIVSLFYGSAYQPTIHVLQVLSIGLFFAFLSFPFGSLIAAQNRQRVNTLIFGIAACVSIVANIILIPFFSSLGSAIAATLTMIVLCLGSMWATRSVMRPLVGTLMNKILRMGLAAIGMGLVLFYFEQRGMFLGALLFIGICVYAGLCVITRVLSKQDIGEITYALTRKH
ncbi:MAG: flippase [Candidatus Uhrbacteria bacterium]|nr:flippase [Candidatus Uhrbacteria bacterium]